MSPTDDRLLLADPQLAIDLLSTLRHDGEDIVDELQPPSQARTWMQEHFGDRFGAREWTRADRGELVQLRDHMRALFTAVVEGQAPPRPVVAAINAAAAQAPVTLSAQRTNDGTLQIQRTSLSAPTATALRAELARAALALLTDDLLDRLRLCRAPRCVLFFLKQHPNQQWCSPSCGNRARVARHYARRHHTESPATTSPDTSRNP